MSINQKTQISQKYIDKFKNLIQKDKKFGQKFDSILYPTCDENCWEFLGRINTDGYGRIEVDNNITLLAHRLSYIIFNGDIPKNLLIRHVCDIRSCINPSHLILGNYLDNRNDAVLRNRIVLGEDTSKAKLKNQDIYEILEDVLNNKYNNVNEICENYNIMPVTLSKVFTGHIWKRETDEYCKFNNISLQSLRSKIKDDKFTHALNEQKVKQIIEDIKNGETIKNISKKFGVSTSNIYGIKNNRIWCHITR